MRGEFSISIKKTQKKHKSFIQVKPILKINTKSTQLTRGMVKYKQINVYTRAKRENLHSYQRLGLSLDKYLDILTSTSARWLMWLYSTAAAKLKVLRSSSCNVESEWLRPRGEWDELKGCCSVLYWGVLNRADLIQAVYYTEFTQNDFHIFFLLSRFLIAIADLGADSLFG